MKLLDSNILIYSSLDKYSFLRDYIDEKNYVSEIARLEVLGFSSITEEEKTYFQSAFSVLRIIPISSNIIDKAIQIRQLKKKSIGDSIIAATSLLFELEIITRNIEDYKNVMDIKLFNPLQNFA